MRLIAFLFLVASSVARAEVAKLTETNYADRTAGRTVFVKFYAPWCGHCKAMAPDWERLAGEWNDHDTALIAEVDCTEEPRLCQDFEVDGYPTLYYGDPSAPETYEGGRDFESMSDFAKQNLGQTICSVFKLDSCTEAEKAVIANYETKTIEELNEELAGVEKKAEEEEAAFDEAVEKLQKQYEEMVSAYNEKVDEIREASNYKFLRAIVSKKEDAKGEEL